MPERESATIQVLREWLLKADNDLKNASHTLTLGQACPTDTVCFHAQQCVEKYLKALLAFLAVPFPKTHNIRDLMNLLPTKYRPDHDEDQQDLLTDYATIIRYPDAGLDIALGEARKAVTVARRVRREVRRLLPKAALRRRKK